MWKRSAVFAIISAMTDIDFLAGEIEKRYGTVKRARGTFLYTAKGVRLTDMYLEGGRAALGWGGMPAFTVFKNVLSRGLTGSFNTDFEKQIKRAVETLLASPRDIYVFPCTKDALQNGILLSKDRTSVWRPWLSGVDWSKVDCVVIEPPIAWCSAVTLLAVKPGLEVFSSLPGTRRLPPALAAALTRSIYDVIKAQGEREEKGWFLYDTVLTKYWRRSGAWLYPSVPEEHYRDFVLHCLDNTLVISPSYSKPSLVPYGADKGVFSKLKANPFCL